MLFGTTIMLDHVMIGGYLAAGLLVFQLLQGKRIMALMVMNQWRIG